jgi:hypothetical protein
MVWFKTQHHGGDHTKKIAGREGNVGAFWATVAKPKSQAQTSCGAAVRVKPKVRLCEPWVMVSYVLRAAKRRQRVHNTGRVDYQ